MLITKKGQISENLYMVGFDGFPVYLLQGEKPIIFEGGITCIADIYIKELKELLGGKEPEMMFVTHAHWDHCGATAALKKAFPSMKIAASELSTGILKKQSAIDMITKLNIEGKDTVTAAGEVDAAALTDVTFAPFEIDVVLHDGDRIEIGNTIVEIIATPGHTRDHTSYYLPVQNILVAGEAGGCLDSPKGDIIVEFVSGYEPYLDSLKKIEKIPADVLCQGHRIVLSGKDEVQKYLKNSLDKTIEFKKRIFELLDEAKNDTEAVVTQIKKECWDWQPEPKQPEGPYLINLRAQIQHLLALKEK